MSLLIDQLAAWLEIQDEGVVGTSIFKLFRPANLLSCISLHATGGFPPDAYTAREKPTVMICCRAATPDEALRMAYRIYNLLHGKQNLDLGESIWILTSEALSSPAYVGTEQPGNGDAHLVSFNIAFDLRQPSTG